MLGFGLWWLGRAEAAARRAGEGYGGDAGRGRGCGRGRPARARARDDRARVRSGRDPPRPPERQRAADRARRAAAGRGRRRQPPDGRWSCCRASTRRSSPRSAGAACSLAAVSGVWAVAVALAAAILTLVLLNRRRLPALRESMDAGRQRLGPARAQRREPGRASGPSSRRCRRSRSCATGCCRSAAGRSSRWPSRPTCSPR